MSTYPGNPSLATAVKDRVASTFEQALSLFKLGRTEEVIAGCTLILQMDPMFDPAKKLLEKAKNPSSPIDISSLIPGSSGGSELQEAREALAARDFQRVVNITTEILTNDLMNDEARILGDEAREKMEAAPFIDQFAKKCEQQLAAGNISGASAALEKMRSLDPTHPSVIRLAQAISGRQPAAAAPSSGFDNSTSFVVDAPSAPAGGGRAPAPAADFGFTFEEDKGGAAPAFNFDATPPPAAPATPPAASSFSFDTPAAGSGGFSFDAPAGGGGGFSFDSGAQPQSGGGFSFDTKQPNAGEFDFSSAASQTSPDDLKKIEQYLADGDGAAAAGDYQQAIDLWSRIFLIDVTNEQASERIERAKMKKREAEDKAEPTLAAAIQAFDRKDYDTARVKFNDVLRIDPSNESALSYINRLPEPSGARPSTPPPAGAKATPPPAAAPRDILEDDEFSGTYEPAMPPEAPPVAKPEKKGDKKAAPAKKSSKGLPVVPIVAVVALLVVIAGGWFAWSKFAKPSYDPKETAATFTQAGVLAKQGKFDEAIALLQDVKPEDPQHDKAVIMIADLQQKKSKGREMIDGKPAAVFFSEQINNGRSAFAAHDYDGAKKSFEAAMRVKQIPADVKAMYDTAAQQVAKLDGAKSLFHERRYQDALGNLVPLLDQDPQNQNIRRMIIDAHFNIGAQDLQQERLDDASKEFDEVLKMDPADELAKKSKELAARYNGQPKDLLYKIYVKYLPLRQAS